MSYYGHWSASQLLVANATLIHPGRLTVVLARAEEGFVLGVAHVVCVAVKHPHDLQKGINVHNAADIEAQDSVAGTSAAGQHDIAQAQCDDALRHLHHLKLQWRLAVLWLDSAPVKVFDAPIGAWAAAAAGCRVSEANRVGIGGKVHRADADARQVKGAARLRGIRGRAGKGRTGAAVLVLVVAVLRRCAAAASLAQACKDVALHDLGANPKAGAAGGASLLTVAAVGIDLAVLLDNADGVASEGDMAVRHVNLLLAPKRQHAPALGLPRRILRVLLHRDGNALAGQEEVDGRRVVLAEAGQGQVFELGQATIVFEHLDGTQDGFVHILGAAARGAAAAETAAWALALQLAAAPQVLFALLHGHGTRRWARAEGGLHHNELLRAAEAFGQEDVGGVFLCLPLLVHHVRQAKALRGAYGQVFKRLEALLRN